MKKKVVILTIISVGTVLLILALNVVSKSLRNTRYGFNRLFPPHIAEELETIELPSNSFYIAGANAHRVYLGISKNPLRLLIADTSGYFFFRKLRADYPKPLNLESLKVIVEGSSFYFRSGVTPLLLKGNLETGDAKRYTYDGTYFSDFVPVGSKTAVMRTMSRSLSKEVLAKISPNSPYIKTAPDLLEKQMDGIFCTDGTLLNDHHGHLVYIYYYRNQFIYTDTSLNLIYRGKTIDTISHAQIKVTKVGDSYTLAEPPLNVNKQSTIDDHWLFVHSGLLAQNEEKTNFDRASVIDVYDLTSGDYKFSFYIFDKGRKKVIDLRVAGNLLYALFDHYLVTYRLKADFFKSNE